MYLFCYLSQVRIFTFISEFLLSIEGLWNTVSGGESCSLELKGIATSWCSTGIVLSWHSCDIHCLCGIW